MSQQDQDAPLGQKPPVKRRRAPKGEKRREALLDAATEVFAQHGYAASSMRDIADIAGITTVGLLHHYPNKNALLEAMLTRRDERITSRFSELDMQPTLSGMMAFARMSMRFSIEKQQECQAALMINVESLAAHHPVFDRFRHKSALTHAHARAHLRHLQDIGEVRAEIDVVQVTIELFAVMDGLQLQWLRDPDDVDIMKVFDRYLERLTAELANV